MFSLSRANSGINETSFSLLTELMKTNLSCYNVYCLISFLSKGQMSGSRRCLRYSAGAGYLLGIWIGGKILGVGGEWTTYVKGTRFLGGGGSGVMLHQKFWKFGPLRMHFLHSGARIRVFEQNRQHKSPLKLLRFQARFFCFSWINLGRSNAPVLWRAFLVLVVK